jgi:hypothetical protein
VIRERRERRIFDVLLQMIPGLEERLVGASAEEIIHVGELVSYTLILDLVQTDPPIDTEGLCQCEIGRHQNLEGSHS